MEVQASPAEVVSLEVLGQDGSLWGSGPAGTLIVERLPQTGDYYLTLCTPSWATATAYTLQVTIPPRWTTTACDGTVVGQGQSEGWRAGSGFRWSNLHPANVYVGGGEA